jgi:hypothetical protein
LQEDEKEPSVQLELWIAKHPPQGPLAAIRSSIDRIVVLLGQGITDKLIESGTLASTNGLHQLGTEAMLETSDLLSLSSTTSVAYLARLLKACMYSVKFLLP